MAAVAVVAARRTPFCRMIVANVYVLYVHSELAPQTVIIDDLYLHSSIT